MGVGAPRCTFVQFSWLGAWARSAPWAAHLSAEGLNRWPLAKLRRCNCASADPRKPRWCPGRSGGRMHCRLPTPSWAVPGALQEQRVPLNASTHWQVRSGTEGVEEGGTGGCGREHEQGGAAAGQGGGWRGGHRQRYIGLSGGGRQKQDKQAPTSAAISNLTADPGCITPCSRREIYNCFSIEGGPRPLSLIQAE